MSEGDFFHGSQWIEGDTATAADLDANDNRVKLAGCTVSRGHGLWNYRKRNDFSARGTT
jgi:hypothetical protein